MGLLRIVVRIWTHTIVFVAKDIAKLQQLCKHIVALRQKICVVLPALMEVIMLPKQHTKESAANK